MVEDEKDPDVIPHGKKTEKPPVVAPSSVHYGELSKIEVKMNA